MASNVTQAQLKAALAPLSTAISGLQGSVRTLQATVASLTTDDASTKKSITTIQTKLSSLEAQVLALVSSGSPSPISGGGGSSVLLTTLTLVNTSGSSQGANFVTPFFGHLFKKGDIPSGTFPQFQLTNGTNCPMSYGMKRTWSDGSWKFGSFFARIPAGISGNGTLTINVMNGGTSPGTSNRTTTELTSAGVVVNATAAAIGSGGANISGVWVANLGSGISDNKETCVIADGAAGKFWRIEGDLKQANSGHGQLICHHYVAALQDSSGNLGGFRYLPRIFQPYYNQDTPAKNWRAFSSVNFQYGAGPTTVNFPYPYNSPQFTWSGGGTFATAAPANNFYTGAGDSSGNTHNMVPGYLTTTGTLPAPLSLNQVYFAYCDKADANVQFCTASSNGGGAVTGTTSGSGVHTFNPVFTCLHFGSIFGATSQGKYNYFQGAGSIAAEPTVQVQFSNTYWHTTKCLPPYDLTVSANDNSTWSYNWDPITIGPFDMFTGNVGERSDIGPIPSWAVRHFYNQSTNSELMIRIMGYAGAHFGNSLRDVTTGGPVNITANTYSGIPSSTATVLSWDGNEGGSGGFTLPPSNNGCWQFGGNETSHIPSCSFYSYIVTGEPQFCDIGVENGLGAIYTLIHDASHRNPTTPGSGATGVIMLPSTQRAAAWGLRNLFQAEGLYPDTSPDSRGTTTMLSDLRSTNVSWLATTLSSATNSYCATNGIWLPASDDAGVCRNSSPWQQSYGAHAVCAAAGLCEDANALTFLSGISTFCNHVLNTWGGYLLVCYYNHTFNVTDGNPTVASIITDDTHFGPTGPMGSFSWVSGTTAAFTPGGTAAHDYAPANGDKIIFAGDFGNPSSLPAGSFLLNTPYYIVNWNSTTHGLATSPGGSAITVTNSSSTDVQSLVVVPANCAISPMSTGVAAGGTGPEGYCASILGMLHHAKALGVAGLDPVITDIQARFTAKGISYVTDPKWACSGSF